LKGTTKDARNCGFYKFYCIVTDDVGQRVESNTAEVAVGCGAKNNVGDWLSFMCFNLGAANNSTIASQTGSTITFQNDSTTNEHPYTAGEENLYGSLFQWGRIADGHEKRSFNGVTRADSARYNGISVADIDSGNRCTASADYRPLSQIKKNTARYGKFIVGNPNWNPLSSQTALDQLWRTSRSLQNDPCAHYNTDGTYQEFWNETAKTSPNNSSLACTDAGTAWRIPTHEEWSSIYRGGTIAGYSNAATANSWYWTGIRNFPGNGKFNVVRSGGYEIRPDGHTTTLFLPAAGHRNNNNALLSWAGSNGYYWSDSVTGTNNAYYLYFEGTSVSPVNNEARALGLAVRCIKST
jgi:uncharacterized protein (TIGR02145 family)